MSLAALATEDNWQAFDEAWARMMESEGDLADLLTALEIVAVKRRMARCLPSVRDHAAKLASGGRAEDAAALIGCALRGGGSPGELQDLLLEYASKAWSGQDWWISYTEIAGFTSGAADIRRAWTYFDDMRSYKEGAVVFHASGWGTGVVEVVEPMQQEVVVRFQSGKSDRFPLRSAVEIFERLPDTDLRAQSLRDPKAVRARLKDEPLEILRAILLRYGGKASNVTLRNALQQIGIDGGAWNAWWKKTRLLAENSEWFRVSGNATRAEIELLKRALDPVASLKKQLQNARNLKDAMTRVRDLFGNANLEPGLKEAGLEAMSSLAADPKQGLDQRLAAWMMLREHRKETPAEMLALLRAAAAEPDPKDPSNAPKLWSILQQIPGAREQEAAIAILEEVLGENWAKSAVKQFQHAPPGMVQPLLERLRAAKLDNELRQEYVGLLARPLRAPFALIALAKSLEESGNDKGLPTGVQRAMALLELAVHLEEAKRGNTLWARAHQRLSDLLVKGNPPLLRRLMADAQGPALRSLRGVLQRGIDDRINDLLGEIALQGGVDLVRMEAVPFWKEDKIWTTRAGLDRRDAELREIKQVKLPQNADAIGRAAAYGDLSENFEWAQAIEEQRQLTTTASTIEQELRKASLLENALIPEGIAAPGTKVTYKETKTGIVHTVSILGPWDSGEGMVSYRAPLAAGMLGLRAGQSAVLELPSGQLAVELISVSPLAQL